MNLEGLSEIDTGRLADWEERVVDVVFVSGFTGFEEEIEGGASCWL